MSITTRYQLHDLPGDRGGHAVRCTMEGCGGAVVRHSLGCGLANHRCVRCFTRYIQPDRRTPQRRPALQRFLHEIVTWHEED